MKKLLYGVPLLFLAGCAEFTQAAKDGVNQFESTVKAPPQLVIDAGRAILGFLGNALSATLEMFLHKFLPF